MYGTFVFMLELFVANCEKKLKFVTINKNYRVDVIRYNNVLYPSGYVIEYKFR